MESQPSYAYKTTEYDFDEKEGKLLIGKEEMYLSETVILYLEKVIAQWRWNECARNMAIVEKATT